MPFRRRLWRACTLIALLLLAGCAATLWSQTAPQHHNQATTASRGKQIFSSACAQCHGLDGKGSERAPNIADRATVQQFSDSQIFHIIQNGIPGNGMPAFHSFDSPQIRAVIAHLRILQGKNKAVVFPGNPEQGKNVFFGKAKCSQCHMIDGVGGFIASDLSEYAHIHSLEQIRSAIVDPASSGRQAQMVTVTLRGGDKYAGRVRDEDNFSIQLQAVDGTFYFLSRSAVDKVQSEPQPLMPSNYGSQLDSHEINDLISYLMKVAGATGSPSPAKVEEWEQ
jgi:cytochrome c oxidase cbb3-type subunit III